MIVSFSSNVDTTRCNIIIYMIVSRGSNFYEYRELPVKKGKKRKIEKNLCGCV